MLICSSVTRVFGRGGRPKVALRTIDLEARPGEVIGVVGSHGAGKSTLLRIVAGRLSPSSGTVRLGGQPVGVPPARRSIGYAADPPLIPNEVNPVEWLSYLASHRAPSPAKREAMVRWATEFGALGGWAKRRVETLSQGMMQRLAVTAAAMTGTALVILDEVFGRLDAPTVRQLGAGLNRVAGTGRIVVIASHDLAAVERLATRVVVLRAGRVVAEESMATFLRERVAELTLSGGGLAAVDRLLQMFDRAVRTGGGVDVPLQGHLSIERVLAACRAERIAVAGSRIRYRRLEDLLTEPRPAEGEGLA